MPLSARDLDSEAYIPKCTKCYMAPAIEHEGVDHPFLVECLVAGEINWSHNSLTFISEADANKYGQGLYMRWTSLKDFRVAAATPS